MADADSKPKKAVTVSAIQYERFITKFQAVELMLHGMIKNHDDGVPPALMDVKAVLGVFSPLYIAFMELESREENHA